VTSTYVAKLDGDAAARSALDGARASAAAALAAAPPSSAAADGADGADGAMARARGGVAALRAAVGVLREACDAAGARPGLSLAAAGFAATLGNARAEAARAARALETLEVIAPQATMISSRCRFVGSARGFHKPRSFSAVFPSE